MNGNPPDRDPVPGQVDDFLEAVARGDAPADDPLAALLGAAARTPATEGMRSGEERLIAEFRAAERPPPARHLPGRRVTRRAITAALATLCLCGIAVVAEHDSPAPAYPTQPAVSVSSGAPQSRPHLALTSTVDSPPLGSLADSPAGPPVNPPAHPPDPPTAGKSHAPKQPHGHPNPKGGGHQKPKPGH